MSTSLNVSRRQVLVAGSASILGWAIDLYDLLLILYVAAAIAPLLFPPEAETLQLAYVYGSFAISLVVRPLGSALFGAFADKNGRKRTMKVTITGVGISTFLMGCVPTYAHVGALAPLLFLALRVAQGIFVGGLVAATHTLGTETAGPRHRGLMSGLVAGAGASGLAAAHRLQQAGLSFTVIEKNSDVGGTWWENNYPGCRLDTPNYAYSFSFAQKEDWPEQFSKQAEIRDYFLDVSRQFNLRSHVRFNTQVSDVVWHEEAGYWELTLHTANGTERLVAQAVISAVGQLNQPKYPDFPGHERFAGQAFHSSRWPRDLDLSGKKVAVIGAGASAYQIVPAIADQVAELTVFQRNAPWMLPTPNYHEAIPDGMMALFREIPYYARWFRFWQFWIATEGRMPFVHVDPDWRKQGSVSRENEQFRQQLLARLREQFADRPDLLVKATPGYPPGAKRMLRDNGVWSAALKKSHVSLVTDGIVEITERGLVTTDGHEHAVDIIVYATGFQASDFLNTLKVTGRHGTTLAERWNGDARAYLGITIPDFPNLFCLYGPNTNLVVNGSILFMAECASEYTLECLRLILERGLKGLDCREQACQAFSAEIDAANSRMVWGASDVSSWYKNDLGRVSQNWPLSLLAYWQLTREPKLDDYQIL